MITRRSFLGAVAAAALPLIHRAKAHIMQTGTPLLLAPERTTLALHAYPDYSGETGQYRLTLGPDQYDPPDDAPTWRYYLAATGRLPAGAGEIERLCRDMGFDATEIDEPMPDMSWVMAWETELSPAARACSLLEQLDLGPDTPGRRREPCLFFNEGSHPGNADRWVEAEDAMSVSLLQLRLIELGLPIRLVHEDG